MNCSNCAGEMRLVHDRDYFVCDYCTTFHFPHADDEGVRVLDEQTQRPCPSCRRSLKVAAVGRERVLHCANCRGLLVDRRAFSVLVPYLRARRRTPPETQAPIEPAELAQRDLRCPRCEAAMETHPYFGPGQVVIDSCGSCALLWLDHGELSAIVRAP